MIVGRCSSRQITRFPFGSAPVAGSGSRALVRTAGFHRDSDMTADAFNDSVDRRSSRKTGAPGRGHLALDKSTLCVTSSTNFLAYSAHSAPETLFSRTDRLKASRMASRSKADNCVCFFFLGLPCSIGLRHKLAIATIYAVLAWAIKREALTSFGSVRFPPACLTSQNNSGGPSIIPKKPKAVVTAGAGHVASLKFIYSIAMLRPARTPQGQTERNSGYLAPTTDMQLATTLSSRPGPSIRSRD